MGASDPVSKGDESKIDKGITHAESGSTHDSSAGAQEQLLAGGEGDPNNGTASKLPSEPTTNSEVVVQKEEAPPETMRDRIDRARQRKGLPPLPRIPDRSDKLEEGDVMLHSGFSRYVIRRNNIAVKYGNDLIRCEADAMRFAKAAGVPVPDVFSVDQGESGPSNAYIEMSFIEGETLYDAWAGLSDETRLAIAHQMRDILRRMRALPAPPGFIGGFNLDEMREFRHYDLFIRPACSNEEEFNNYLTEDPEIPGSVARAFRRRIGTSHKIVFSHCDLAARNIMVRDGRIVAILDWEVSGWYPEYWEYTRFVHSGGRDCGWKGFVDEIFPEPYEDEILIYTGLLWYQSKFDTRSRNIEKITIDLRGPAK